MKAILVFIDGTICNRNPTLHLMGTPKFYEREAILKDLSVPDSVQSLQELAQEFRIVYFGARPESALPFTTEWLRTMGFPEGHIYLRRTQEERLALVKDLRKKYDFVAGIGDRWDDNELHLEIGCLSIILKANEGNWSIVPELILKHQRQQKFKENEIHLRGKIEGLARVLPRLDVMNSDKLWEAHFEAVMKMAETTRESREKDDRESFAEYGLNPEDLRDVAQWNEISREEDWENDPAFGLQDVETVEATERRYVAKVTRCRYAELWQEHGRSDIGYQIHCRCDTAWWDRPAWNPKVRFQQPKTLMQGDDCCLFVQYLPDNE